MGVSCLLSRHARATTTSQILDHFRQTWTDGRLPRQLGLAVSGGADSMALAYLCNRLEKSKLVDGLSVTAFVVDHKAREESSREAAVVASWLSQMGNTYPGPLEEKELTKTGLTTKILELKWPGAETAKPTAFETVARRLRFQALGTACRDMHVETLLMGHHQDDNIETTLWRLCTGSRGAGLAGIPAVANIPECHGLYGVSGSGSFFTLASSGADRWRVTTTGEVVNSYTPNTMMGCRVSTGSITVCRPLLGLPKRYLLETCREHSVPFVEDPTNFDPTLTPRNAIRALRSENRLPRALGTESVLSLIDKSRAFLDTCTRLSDDALASCNILRLDLAAGWMVIRFPSEGNVPRSHQILTVVLRRITELISPFPDAHFPLRSFAGFTGRVFPSNNTVRKDAKDSRQPFTLGGVMFQPLRYRPATSTENPTPDGNNTWLLTRQPFMRHRLPSIDFTVPISSAGDQDRRYTQWTLWDNRYWIRIGAYQHQHQHPNMSDTTSTPTSHTRIRIRPLQQKDIQRLRNLFSKNSKSKSEYGSEHPVWTHLSERLSRDAPGSARFTVPVLVAARHTTRMEEEEEEEEEEDVLLALPTLGIRLPVVDVKGIWPWEVHWEWMYKEINRATVTLMGFSTEDR